MANREEVVTAINTFIKNPTVTNNVKLFEFAFEIEDPEKKDDMMKYLSNNLSILPLMTPKVLDFLQAELEINNVLDKNYNIITVF